MATTRCRLDDVLSHLRKAVVYSVLVASNGFWHLDDASSRATPFNTPFGRFRWRLMPFGIKSTPAEFHRRQDQTLKGLDGILCVADDILVCGEGNTRSKAATDRDRKLCSLLQRL